MHTEDQSTWQLALHTEGNCVGSWQMCGLGVFMLAHTVGMLSTWFVQFWQTIRCNATEHSIVYSQELTILFAPIVRFTLNAGTPFWSIHLNQCRLFQRFIHIRTTYSSISSHFIIFFLPSTVHFWCFQLNVLYVDTNTSVIFSTHTPFVD